MPKKLCAAVAVFGCVAAANLSPALAQDAGVGAKSNKDVEKLFATTCGWCHNDGGRVAGKGPQLMGTKRSDDFIRMRIMLGKPGAMPSFSGVFTDTDLDAIIHYIRTLKPEDDTQKPEATK